MELKVKRIEFTDESTIGELYINDKLAMYTLEDCDRGLKDDMPIEGIKAIKVHSLTAIPTGRYQLVMSFSNRFQKYLPEILNVKGFAGIRMHTGNKAADSEGCILVGKTKTKNFISGSKIAFEGLLKEIQRVEKTEKIYITIEK